MKKCRALRIGAIASTGLFCIFGILGLYALAKHPDPRVHHVRLGLNFGIARCEGGAHLVVFNNEETGPYLGGTVSIARAGSISASDHETQWTYPGLYFQSFGSLQHVWTLLVSFWYPLAAFLVLPLLYALRHRSGKESVEPLTGRIS